MNPLWIVPPVADPDGPTTGDDRAILVGDHAWQRATFWSICAGLNGDQLATRALPSTQLSLLGIARHLAKVERIWLRQRAAGQDVPALHGGPGDPSDFAGTDATVAEQEFAALQEEWRHCDSAAAGLPFDHEVRFRDQVWSLRMTYVHLIGEYARHNGHADLLREAIDGVTGR